MKQIFLLLLLLFAQPLLAAYYISPSGNDSNDGSIGSPWLTPQKCANVLGATNPGPGGTCYFRAGTYTAPVSGVLMDMRTTPVGAIIATQANPAIIANYPGETVTFTCPTTYDSTLDDPGPNYTTDRNLKSEIAIYGLSNWVTIQGDDPTHFLIGGHDHATWWKPDGARCFAAVIIGGSHNTLDKITVQHSWGGNVGTDGSNFTEIKNVIAIAGNDFNWPRGSGCCSSIDGRGGATLSATSGFSVAVTSSFAVFGEGVEGQWLINRDGGAGKAIIKSHSDTHHAVVDVIVPFSSTSIGDMGFFTRNHSWGNTLGIGEVTNASVHDNFVVFGSGECLLAGINAGPTNVDIHGNVLTDCWSTGLGGNQFNNGSNTTIHENVLYLTHYGRFSLGGNASASIEHNATFTDLIGLDCEPGCLGEIFGVSAWNNIGVNLKRCFDVFDSSGYPQQNWGSLYFSNNTCIGSTEGGGAVASVSAIAAVTSSAKPTESILGITSNNNVITNFPVTTQIQAGASGTLQSNGDHNVITVAQQSFPSVGWTNTTVTGDVKLVNIGQTLPRMWADPSLGAPDCTPGVTVGCRTTAEFIATYAPAYAPAVGSPILTAGAADQTRFNTDILGKIRLPGSWTAGAIQNAGSAPVTQTLTLASSNPSSGASIALSPISNDGKSSCSTPCTAIYNQNVAVSITATTPVSGQSFQKWQKDAVDYAGSVNTNITMNADHTMTAVYVAPAPTTHVLTVSSSNPSSGAAITMGINDNSGVGSGLTSFTRTFNTGTSLSVTARAKAGAPLLWWRMEEGSGGSLSDSGSSFTGTAHNSPTWTIGIVGAAALSFDGSTQFVDTPDSAPLNPPKFYLAARIKPLQTLSGMVALAVKNQDQIWLYANGGSGYCGGNVPVGGFLGTDNAFHYACSPTQPQLAANAISYPAIRYDGTTLDLFVNGNKIATTTTSVPVKTTSGTFSVGASIYGEFCNCVIDDVKFDDVPPTDQQALNDYNQAVAQTNTFASWGGCDSASGQTCNVTMSADKTVTASYTTPSSSVAVLTASHFQFYNLRNDANGNQVVVPYPGIGIDNNAKVVQNGAFTVSIQTDVTNADPPFLRLVRYYSRNGGSYTALSDTCGSDHICFEGNSDTSTDIPADGLVVTSCLSIGVLAPQKGLIHRRSSAFAIQFFHDQCAANRAILKFSGAVVGDTYDFRDYYVSGAPIDAYAVTPRVTVIRNQASGS